MGYLGGMGYVALELLWRRWSHGSMFLVGGVCFLLLEYMDRRLWELPMVMLSVLGACILTAMELCSGLIINGLLGLRVWDYSRLPYNFMGQICISYFFLWILVSFGAIWLSRLLRYRLFGENIRVSLPHRALERETENY